MSSDTVTEGYRIDTGARMLYWIHATGQTGGEFSETRKRQNGDDSFLFNLFSVTISIFGNKNGY